MHSNNVHACADLVQILGNVFTTEQQIPGFFAVINIPHKMLNHSNPVMTSDAYIFEYHRHQTDISLP